VGPYWGLVPGQATESVELGRFVLLDSVAGNGESWFLGQCYRVLKHLGLRGVLSFSDPVPRARADGEINFPGHLGTIYQAHNGVYLGRGTARTLMLLPDGTVFSDRAIQKIRQQEQGWQYACETLVAFGASPVYRLETQAWLKCWLPAICRKLRHPGNYKYGWSLYNALMLPETLAYPKAA
jgi:hypothetical protein